MTGIEREESPKDAELRRRPVVVAHRDDAVRAGVALLLDDAGYAVRLAPDAEAGLTLVRLCEEPVVVLFEMDPSGQTSGRFLELALLEAARLDDGRRSADRAFVALCKPADHLPPRLVRLLRRLDVSVVREPFELEALLLVVAQASARCAAHERESARLARITAPPARASARPRAHRTREPRR